MLSLLKNWILVWRGEAPVNPRHGGFIGFLRDDIVPLAITTGLLCTLGIIPYTAFLSHQIYECPTWAANCQVYTQRIGTIQGAVTLVYTLGLICLAYACWALVEVCLWPLLCKQPFTLTQIDRYLAVSRGSIPSIPLIIGAIKSWDITWILLGALIATVTSFSAGPVVGYVFDQPYLPTAYEGRMSVGGGFGSIFTQKNPPELTILTVAAFYSDYNSDNSGPEPMPKHRDWIIDKVLLSTRGNFSAHAVRVKRNVTCDGFRLTQTKGPNSRLRRRIYFETEMANMTGLQRTSAGSSTSSRSAEVWNIRKLSVWAHRAIFHPPNGASVKIVMAVPGGTLEGGIVTYLNPNFTANTRPEDHRNISAIACDIDIELADEILTVGSRQTNDQTVPEGSLPVLSKVSNLHSFNRNATFGSSNYTHEEVALYFALAPIMSGFSKAGTQPMFEPLRNRNNTQGRLISAFGSSDSWITSDYVWQRRQIENFINGSISAVSQALSTTYRSRHITMKSQVYAHRMEPARNVLLAVPVIVMLTTWVFLAMCAIRLHKRHNLPVMKLGETADILEAWHNGHWVSPEAQQPDPSSKGESFVHPDQGVVRVVYRPTIPHDGVFGLIRNIPAATDLESVRGDEPPRSADQAQMPDPPGTDANSVHSNPPSPPPETKDVQEKINPSTDGDDIAVVPGKPG